MVDTWRSRVPEIARYASKVKLVDIRGKFMLDGSQDIGDFIERLQDIRRAKEAEELQRLWPQVW